MTVGWTSRYTRTSVESASKEIRDFDSAGQSPVDLTLTISEH